MEIAYLEAFVLAEVLEVGRPWASPRRLSASVTGDVVNGALTSPRAARNRAW